jgi:hypothetical protein
MSTNDEYSNKILAIRKLAEPYGVKVKESSRDHPAGIGRWRRSNHRHSRWGRSDCRFAAKNSKAKSDSRSEEVKNGEIVVSSENTRSRRGIGWKSGSPLIKIHHLAASRIAINNLAKVRPGVGINRTVVRIVIAATEGIEDPASGALEKLNQPYYNCRHSV